ncbi:lanthionine synthetase C family protein [Parabacteroides goldsteinii]|uniref:lanthionine synthetase C family protein n=1 Tax=Parabacteroides goldsteinii TaxID=328812 RepID=UPI0032B13219
MKYKELEIVNSIYKELMSCDLSGNIGLHGGTSGIALFLSYYDNIILQKNEISQRVFQILEYNIQWINSGKKIHTLCRGLSGFGWLCEHLRKMDMLSNVNIEFLDDLDHVLYKQMIYDIKHENYEFLHGAIGVGTYFLSRFDKNKEVIGYIEELLIELEQKGILCESKSVKWLSVLNFQTGEKGYDISMSHGMSSIAAFLIRLHQLNFEVERVERLLASTIAYILEQITYKEGNISYFPTHSKESGYGLVYSRLAWCYGDLSIAHVLWRVAILMNNKELENTALRILYYNSNRLDLQSNGICDACLCHGTAGIAQIFWNIYLNTHINKFKETTEYWIHQTIQMAKHPDGLAGFKAWNTDEYGGGYVNSVGLLEGIAGIGLVLLSQLTEKKLVWDESLMLT